MTPDRSHSDIVGRIANKVRVEEGENPYFYVPKYHSSDAVPAPEIFIFFPQNFRTPWWRGEWQKTGKNLFQE